MIAQRAADAAPALQGVAEAIPLADDSVDAAMAVITDHHWSDRALGLAEMQRIARKRVVALTLDLTTRFEFWLMRDYLTEYGSLVPEGAPGLCELAVGEHGDDSSPCPFRTTASTASGLRSGGGPPRISIPMYVPGSASSTCSMSEHVERAMERLADDLASGAWAERNRDLLELDDLDLGLRLVVWAGSWARERRARACRPSRRRKRGDRGQHRCRRSRASAAARRP